MGICPAANSFSADTTVQTAEGDVPISEIEVGDTVLAYNETTGEIGEYTVTATINHTDEVIIHLTIDGELIETTPEHPFYTADGEWVEAADLQPGDQIYALDGTYGTVESVVVVEDADQQMYNLTIDTAHTFFAGDSVNQWKRALSYFHGRCAVCERPLNDLLATHTAAADHWVAVNKAGIRMQQTSCLYATALMGAIIKSRI